MLTVIIPAHNQGQVIGRLLARLAPAAQEGALELIVVANGCADDTAAVAAGFGAGIRVVSIPVASKHLALRAGDRAAAGFPRAYVDADVEIGPVDLRSLAAALEQPGVLAAAPRRALDTSGSGWAVRWYYEVWVRLPEVRRGLFGRGVVAVGEAGHARLARLPLLLADDLAASLSFTPAERRVVDGARVLIRVPRTLPGLVRRRVRVVTGAGQAVPPWPAGGAAARTRLSDLAALVRRQPRLAPRVALFLAVAVLARTRHALARGDGTSWQRGNSSRRS